MTGVGRPDAAPVTVWVRRLDPDVDRRVAADAMVAAMAATYGIGDAQVSRDGEGRPVLLGGAHGVHVSISHHLAYVATAITRRGPIGVDVEVARDLPARAMADRFYAKAETLHLSRLVEPELTVEFLRLWTVKEAVGKALGTGLRGGGLGRRVGPLPPWPAGGPLTLAALDEVTEVEAVDGFAEFHDEDDRDEGRVVEEFEDLDGMAVAGCRDGDLLVAVACRAVDAAGARVTVERGTALADRG